LLKELSREEGVTINATFVAKTRRVHFAGIPFPRLK
jgi:hypothetical protein